MSYLTNIDNIDIEKVLAESKRTRMGLEGSNTYQTTTVIDSGKKDTYQYQPSTYQTSVVQKEYVPYQPNTVVQQEYVPYKSSEYVVPSTTYQTSAYQYSPSSNVRASETVKRAGLVNEGQNIVTTTYVTNQSSGSVSNRLEIIMLGAEIERVLELGRDVEFRYNQLSIEIITLKEKLSSCDRTLEDIRIRGGDSSEYQKLLQDREREILLLKNNVTDTVVSPETENLRKKQKAAQYENDDLRRNYESLQVELNRMSADLKGRSSRPNAAQKKSTAWCC